MVISSYINITVSIAKAVDTVTLNAFSGMFSLDLFNGAGLVQRVPQTVFKDGFVFLVDTMPELACLSAPRLHIQTT